MPATEPAWRLRVHGFEPSSLANGPGRRAVLWVQGCSLGCAGCFNPQSHPRQGGLVWDWPTAWHTLGTALTTAGGLTVSGGEPFDQAAALASLLGGLRRERDCPVILFSGYTWTELQARPSAAPLLGQVDLLIAGRYVESLRVARDLTGSANKTLHFLTDRYTRADLDAVPPAEVLLHPDGTLTVTGIDPLRVTPYRRSERTDGHDVCG